MPTLFLQQKAPPCGCPETSRLRAAVIALPLAFAPVAASAQQSAEAAPKLTWVGPAILVQVAAPEGQRAAPREKLPLSFDASVARPARLLESAVFARVGPELVVAVDAFASKPAGLSRCKAGRERFLRLVKTTPGAVREMAALKIESCLDDLELAPDGLRYDAAQGELALDWSNGPGGAPSRLTWSLRAAGREAK